jgi:hypothetical protein
MKKTLHLGKDSAGKDFTVPLSFITGTTAILGIRGGGKTETGVDIAEEIVKVRYPVGIVDPLDVWHGARSSFDGKSAGLPIIVFGGRHGDVPLDPSSGAVLARFLMKERVPIIMALKLMSHAQQARFMYDFATTISRYNDDPLHIIIDEAARFAPQQLPKMAKEPKLRGRADIPGIADCAYAVQNLGSENRAGGVGLTVIGQRASRINKDLLTQCETLIAMRTQGSQDRNALLEWMEAHGTPEQLDTMMRELASLPTGTGYVWSPSALGVFKKVHFRRRETFDTSRTPKVGEKRLAPKAFAKIDLDTLRGEIASVIEEAKADDPVALRAQIAQLRNDVRAAEARTHVPSSVPVERRVEVPIEVKVVPAEVTAALKNVANVMADTASQLAAVEELVEKAAFKLNAAKAEVAVIAERAATYRTETAVAAPVAMPPAESTRRAAAPSTHPSSVDGSPAPSDVSLRKGARRMLQELARTGGVLTNEQLSTLSGINRGGTYYAYKRDLVNAFYVEDGGTTIRLLQAGADAIGEPIRNEPKSLEEAVAPYREKLRAGAVRMLDILLARYPQEVDKDDLSSESGVTRGGTYYAYQRDLIRNGLATSTKRGLRASETLFMGRR